jgi:SPP1 family predicted phage head-tail adaptor
VAGFADIGTTPTVWARWINAHGAETVQSTSLQDTQRATVLIRYRADVIPAWRILKDGEAWQILSVDQVQDRNRWVEMVVERTKGTV